jgi:sialic acid synthase SpsE
MIGETVKQVSPQLKGTRNEMLRCVVAAKSLGVGQIVGRDDISIKRPNPSNETKISPFELE